MVINCGRFSASSGPASTAQAEAPSESVAAGLPAEALAPEASHRFRRTAWGSLSEILRWAVGLEVSDVHFHCGSPLQIPEVWRPAGGDPGASEFAERVEAIDSRS